jgi:Arc/MetJ-type ribon-helix-helix transcriptional regulator
MNVPLSELWQQFIRAKVRAGQFASEAEVIEASLRLMEDQGRPPGAEAGTAPVPARKPIWERVDEMTGSIPEEEFLKLPADGAEQHDHYIYGTSKRSS